MESWLYGMVPMCPPVSNMRASLEHFSYNVLNQIYFKQWQIREIKCCDYIVLLYKIYNSVSFLMLNLIDDQSSSDSSMKCPGWSPHNCL